MGRKAIQPEPGTVRPLKIKLSPDLNVDLWAFCEVHHGAPQSRVVEKAVRAFIDAELQRHPTLVAEWKLLRGKVRSKPEVVQFPDHQEDEP